MLPQIKEKLATNTNFKKRKLKKAISAFTTIIGSQGRKREIQGSYIQTIGYKLY